MKVFLERKSNGFLHIVNKDRNDELSCCTKCFENVQKLHFNEWCGYHEWLLITASICIDVETWEKKDTIEFPYTSAIF